MVLPDTSISVDVFRDRTGVTADSLFAEIGEDQIVTTRVVELELLAGAKNEHEWASLQNYVESLPMLEHKSEFWQAAARMFFDLHGALLIHNDRDFERIATVYPLKQKNWI